MLKFLQIFSAAVLLCIAGPVLGQTPPHPGLEHIGLGKVGAVVDGDTFTLEDGRDVRLVGIQAPKLPLGRRGFAAWPYSNQAKGAFAALAQGQSVHLWSGGAQVDRHGRILAHVTLVDSGAWLQKALLEQGAARVYSFADNRAAAAPLYAAEETARRYGRGLWAHPIYAVQKSDSAHKETGFELVEGTVYGVSHLNSFTYVNFGPDWRTDFTVRIAPKNRRNFGDTEEQGKAWLDALKDKNVRVRGWLFQRGGAMIEISHAEAIELLPADGKN